MGSGAPYRLRARSSDGLLLQALKATFTESETSLVLEIIILIIVENIVYNS